MIYVIFEVKVKENYMDQYLSLAADLKSHLEKCEGFIRSERFASFAEENKLLSLSVWESEEDVARWRNQVEHRLSQKHCRDSLFDNYTITVASGIRSYTDTCREEAPADSNEFHIL